MTKEEIIDHVYEGDTAVVWITDKGAIIYTPGDNGCEGHVGAMAGVGVEFFDDPDFQGAPITIVQGVDGLAATDPSWDGEDIFTCENPECGMSHPVDWMVHENVWQYAESKRKKVPLKMKTTRWKRRKNIPLSIQ